MLIASLCYPFLTQTVFAVDTNVADPTAAATTGVLKHDDLFDRTKLLEVKIEMEPSDWDSLRMVSRNFAVALMKPAQPSPFKYFKGNVTINGKRIESVGIRKKGFIGSMNETRPSLKIKFDAYVEQQPVDGLSRLTLNNNNQDEAQASQYVTYKLFADAKLPAPRCSLAHVTVNGESLGIYSNVESVKTPMLKRQFGDASGKLYEGTLADFLVGREGDLEAKGSSAEENRDEIELVSKLLAEDELNVEELNEIVDIDQFLRFWAMESLTNHWDGYTNNQNNYFAYFHSTDKKFRFIPWGADAGIMKDRKYAQFERGPESVHGKSALATRLYATDGFAARYRETMNELLKQVWNEDELVAELDRIEDLVEGHLHEGQKGFERTMKKTRSFVKYRRRVIEKELLKWPQKVAKAPRSPFYTSKAGSAVGTFSTVWTAKTPEAVYEAGEGELDITVDGTKMEFEKLGVHSTRSTMSNPNGERPPTVVFVGKRESDGKRITLAVGVSESQFRGSTEDQTVQAQGMLMEGLAFFLNKNGIRMAGGSVQFKAAGTEPDDEVIGRVNVDILRFNGSPR